MKNQLDIAGAASAFTWERGWWNASFEAQFILYNQDDRANNLLYVLELFADGAKSVVHVCGSGIKAPPARPDRRDSTAAKRVASGSGISSSSGLVQPKSLIFRCCLSELVDILLASGL